MSFDLKRVLDGKRAYRRKLRALPVVEKLRLLDELRARSVTLSQASVPPAHEPGMVKEGPTPYRAEPKLMTAEAGRARRRAGKSA